MDDYQNFFTTTGQLEQRHEVYHEYCEFSLDFFVAEIVECVALVAAWRGVENTFDLFVFPKSYLYSILTYLVSSHFIYIFVAFIQTCVYKRFSKSTLITRLIAEDFMYIVMFIASVLSWKFYWDFIDYFILGKSNQLVLYLIAHSATFVIALCLKVSAVLVGPGASFLDTESVQSSSYFQVNYLTTIYKVSLLNFDFNTDN
jgi:hypothetical protein